MLKLQLRKRPVRKNTEASGWSSFLYTRIKPNNMESSFIPAFLSPFKAAWVYPNNTGAAPCALTSDGNIRPCPHPAAKREDTHPPLGRPWRCRRVSGCTQRSTRGPWRRGASARSPPPLPSASSTERNTWLTLLRKAATISTRSDHKWTVNYRVICLPSR